MNKCKSIKVPVADLDARLLKEKREIVAKLERQNREIAKEIQRLRMKQANAAASSTSNQYLDYDSSSTDYLIHQYQLLQQQQQQRTADNYSNIYATVSAAMAPGTKVNREATPAVNVALKKGIDPSLIAELRTLKVGVFCF